MFGKISLHFIPLCWIYCHWITGHDASRQTQKTRHNQNQLWSYCTVSSGIGW